MTDENLEELKKISMDIHYRKIYINQYENIISKNLPNDQCITMELPYGKAVEISKSILKDLNKELKELEKKFKEL